MGIFGFRKRCFEAVRNTVVWTRVGMILAMFVHKTRLPWAVCWSRGRRLSSPHSGESSERLFILRFNFWRLGECGATTVRSVSVWCNITPEHWSKRPSMFCGITSTTSTPCSVLYIGSGHASSSQDSVITFLIKPKHVRKDTRFRGSVPYRWSKTFRTGV